MSKFYNDNKPVPKDLTSDIDAHVGLGWRILAAIAIPALFVAICCVGFRLVLSVGVAS